MNVKRLNYIGSKYQLLDWIKQTIETKTGWTSFGDKKIADLFAGTGVVSHYFRLLGAEVHSNDAEKYSSIISHALTRSTCTTHCLEVIEEVQNESCVGFITRHYSPYEGNERMFFTIENAMKIDGIRKALINRTDLSDNKFKFLLASLIISADAVSNVPAVYGCYLKNFKAKALKKMILAPIHTLEESPCSESQVYNCDVINGIFPKFDAVYLDPPYNERQYSKNYFPLNMIVEQSEKPLKGKTGIPEECFLSSFCRKGQVVASFEKLVQNLKTDWIFLSYSSESLISKDNMMTLLGKYGIVSIVERDYKRFKSFEYNADNAIKEYIFCLQKFNI